MLEFENMYKDTENLQIWANYLSLAYFKAPVDHVDEDSVGKHSVNFWIIDDA